jgi:hypothetical protein
LIGDLEQRNDDSDFFLLDLKIYFAGKSFNQGRGIGTIKGGAALTREYS